MITDEYRYRILKLIENNPEISQRELAKKLGISLGRVNFCLKALVDVGLLKVNNFLNSKNKWAYMYLLTPKGVEEKAKLTLSYLEMKLIEYEKIKSEIQELKNEIRF